MSKCVPFLDAQAAAASAAAVSVFALAAAAPAAQAATEMMQLAEVRETNGVAAATASWDNRSSMPHGDVHAVPLPTNQARQHVVLTECCICNAERALHRERGLGSSGGQLQLLAGCCGVGPQRHVSTLRRSAGRCACKRLPTRGPWERAREDHG